jgi:hypothetical protein
MRSMSLPDRLDLMVKAGAMTQEQADRTKEKRAETSA